MKRNMDLVRTLLQKIESCSESYGLETIPEITDYDMDTISYHVKLLIDAGLVEADPGPMGMGYVDYTDINLTWKGQDFLSASNDDSLWSKAKEHVIKPGASFTFDLLFEWLVTKAKEKLLIP
ncbi:MAG: DUF2513 domain-containing protein [Desulfobulbaceae bacterium]|nr:DUF2513 domain-containing protein [Desulfobulbaceae bacterium]